VLILLALLGAGLNVSPVQIWLSPDASKSLLTLRNESDAETRYQLSVSAWDEDAQQGMKLSPTDAIIFFPRLLSLKPGDTKNVRIGATVPFGAVEKTFRIFVEELPPPQKPQGKSEVRVLTRVGIPIFVAPVKSVSDRKLSALTMDEKGRATLEVENTGNVHLRVEAVKLEAYAEGGARLFERSISGWYVLAGGHKRYEVEVPKSDCARVRRLVASVKTDRDEIFQQPLDTPLGACGG
jgi:fimbrial chaperone protein